MYIYTLRKKQILPLSLDQAWHFFSNPRNLKTITPPELGFQILEEDFLPDQIYPGMIVAYRVSPILKIPLTWVTEITQVKEFDYFVDEQRAGPYALWHHEHFFKDHPDGVEIVDIIHYGLPFWFLGAILNQTSVKKKLEEIFEFREAKLKLLFCK